MAHTMRRDPFRAVSTSASVTDRAVCLVRADAPARFHLRLGQGRPNTVRDGRASQGQDVLCVRLFHCLPLIRTPQCRKTNRSARSPSSSRPSCRTIVGEIQKLLWGRDSRRSGGRWIQRVLECRQGMGCARHSSTTSRPCSRTTASSPSTHPSSRASTRSTSSSRPTEAPPNDFDARGMLPCSNAGRG